MIGYLLRRMKTGSLVQCLKPAVADTLTCMCATDHRCQSLLRKEGGIEALVHLMLSEGEFPTHVGNCLFIESTSFLVLCKLYADCDMVESSATALGALCWQNDQNIKAILECGGIEALVLSLRKGQDPYMSTVTASRILSHIVSLSHSYHVLTLQDQDPRDDRNPSSKPGLPESNLKDGGWAISRSSSTYAPTSSVSSIVTQSPPMTPTADSPRVLAYDPDSTLRILAIKNGVCPEGASSDLYASTSSPRLSKLIERNKAQDPTHEISTEDRLSSDHFGEMGMNIAETLSKFIAPELMGDAQYGMKLLVSLVLLELSISNEEVHFELSEILKYGLQPLASQFTAEMEQQNPNPCVGFWEGCANKIPIHWFRY